MSDTTPPKRRGNPNFGKPKPITAESTPVDTSVEETATEKVQATPQNDVMQAILDELQSIRKENEALKASVDQQKYKTAIANYTDDKRLLVRLRKFNDDIVVAWSNMKTNAVRIGRNGEEVSDQTVEITFLDGRQEVHAYDAVFNNTNKTEELPVNGTLKKGDKTIYLVDINGQEVQILETFING